MTKTAHSFEITQNRKERSNQFIPEDFDNIEFLDQWINTEITLWDHLSQKFQSLDLNGEINNAFQTLHRNYNDYFKRESKTKSEIIKRDLSTGNIISLQSELGKIVIRNLILDPHRYVFVLSSFSSHLWTWPESDRIPSEVKSFRADMAATAAYTADVLGKKIGEMSFGAARAKSILDQIETALGEESERIQEREKEIERLRAAYIEYVRTSTAASYWRRKTTSAHAVSALAFVIFAVGVIAPLYMAYLHWPTLWGVIKEASTLTSTGIPLGTVGVFVIPVLAYAWVLKQVSRFLVSSRDIADDAGYRSVMIDTYLGLTKDSANGVSDTERGIIINAIFRPTPSSKQDDGPPTSLLDLLNGRKP